MSESLVDEVVRQNLIYYRYVSMLVQGFAADVKSMVDVGSGDRPLIEEFDWIPKRVCVDKKRIYQSENVKGILVDFFDYEPEEKFDFGLCLQTLEHIPDAKKFTRKLFEIANHVLISVPYKWKAGTVAGHIHDPVDLDKIIEWAGRKPRYHIVVEEPFTGHKRLICYYPPRGEKVSVLEARKKAMNYLKNK